MKKKGISPLIATVLILGFTVALAAVIMTWGTGFTKKMQTSTEETSAIQITCATDVIFDVQSVCETATSGSYKLVVANNGNIGIDRFEVRFYASDDDVKSETYFFNESGAAGLEAFAIESQIEASGYTEQGKVKQIDAIPVITMGGKEVTCAQTIDTYGSVDSPSVIPKCT